MVGLIFKGTLIWLMIVVIAIANGAVREKLLIPIIGSGISLPVSGLLLSLLIFIVAYVSVPYFGYGERNGYIAVGVLWFFLTLAFEFLFGHFIGGKPWADILQVFNIRSGDLFAIALITTLVSPWFSAKLRGLI